MTDDALDQSTPAAPQTVGETLRTARERMGLDLGDIARATRVPQRHLEAIEDGNYAVLPSPTYATGFVKAYARVVELDEVAVAARVRQEMTANPVDAREYHPYETADPKRVPPRGLAWVGLAVALLVVGLFGWWYAARDALPPETAAPVVAATGTGTPPGAAGAPAIGEAAATLAAPASAAGPVELVATAPVWMRITVANGDRLVERELAAGERYTVPVDAQEPTIRIGRPESLDVYVGGRRVAPLGPAGRPVGGIVLTAAALDARGQADAPAAPDNATAPVDAVVAD